MPGRRGAGFCKGKGRVWLEGFVLLMLAEKPSHGYDLAKNLNAIGLQSEGVGSMGGLYRILGDMEAFGLLESRWNVDEPGPAKKEYEITQTGIESLLKYEGYFAEVKALAESFEQGLRKYKNQIAKEE